MKGEYPVNPLRYELVREFAEAYKIAFGVRPLFTVGYLTNAELHGRTALIKATAGEYPVLTKKRFSDGEVDGTVAAGFCRHCGWHWTCHSIDNGECPTVNLGGK